MKRTNLSNSEARALALRGQLLDGKANLLPGKDGVFQTIDQLGYVQIDTIAAVKRAHHQTLWARHRDYTEEQLHDLQSRDRLIFEYWGHAMSYLPISDYRYCLPRMQNFRNPRHAWVSNRLQGCAHLIQPVLERIRKEGPLGAKDFTALEDEKRGAWWDWKPAKFALEFLFWRGDLMIAERRNFQKIYDLTERVLPAQTDTTMPSDSEVGRFLVRRALQACGVAREKDMQGYLQPAGARDSDWQAVDPAAIQNAIQELSDAGEIVPLAIEGDGSALWYALASAIERISQVEPGPVFLLSPFDNLIIRRQWLEKLFGFDYTLECYLPEKKRQFGYFVFPILWGDRLIGRLDPKADRKARTLIIRNLVFEPGFEICDEFLARLRESLTAFARFNGCQKYVLPGRGRNRLKL